MRAGYLKWSASVELKRLKDNRAVSALSRGDILPRVDDGFRVEKRPSQTPH